MRKYAVLIILVVLLVCPVHAQQPPEAPMVFLVDQDLWTWSSGALALTPLTHGAFIREGAISPDGTRLAVLALSPVTIDAVNRVGGFSGYWPMDIILIDIRTGVITPVAVQPDDARLFAEDGSPDSAWLRSLPGWSPDGTKLAWTELHYPSFAPETRRLAIYDVSSSTTQVIVTGLPETAGAGPIPIAVMWGEPGLALWVPTYDPADSTFPTDFLIYTPDGQLLSQTRVPDDWAMLVTDFTWVATSQGEQLGLLYGNGAWELIDPSTGTRQPPAGAVELYSLTAPAASVTFRFTIDPNANDYWQNHIWEAVYPDGRVVPLAYHGHDILIAPDGGAFAYIDQNGLLTIDGVAASTVLQAAQSAIGFWGPTGWRLSANAGSLPAASCPGALPPRLGIGKQARVIPNTSSNNLRDTPATGAVLQQIPAGGVFTVLAGPTCADSINWWQVNYNGTIGWTAEGDANGYWLEPVP
jgi:hypothetical protein